MDVFIVHTKPYIMLEMMYHKPRVGAKLSWGEWLLVFWTWKGKYFFPVKKIICQKLQFTIWFVSTLSFSIKTLKVFRVCNLPHLLRDWFYWLIFPYINLSLCLNFIFPPVFNHQHLNRLALVLIWYKRQSTFIIKLNIIHYEEITFNKIQLIYFKC